LKPQFLKIAPPGNASINLYEQEVPYFATPWHYHPEFEIVLIKTSVGKKYVGSSISEFEPDDLCMIGSLLPHFYKNTQEYYDPASATEASSYVMHFREDCFGEAFWGLPEVTNVQDLLLRSKKGLQFGKAVAQQAKPLIAALFEKEATARIIAFLEVVHLLSSTKDYTYLNEHSIELRNEADSDRIKKVYEFVMQNFKEDICLNDAAQLASMSESAFSRYFKKRTRLTFSSFLTGVRVEYACRKLRETEKSIAEIAFESGFNNLSNFNRQFKVLKKMTPFAYKNTY
jgi:AraC-like DNA-binding protein